MSSGNKREGRRRQYARRKVRLTAGRGAAQPSYAPRGQATAGLPIGLTIIQPQDQTNALTQMMGKLQRRKGQPSAALARIAGNLTTQVQLAQLQQLASKSDKPGTSETSGHASRSASVLGDTSVPSSASKPSGAASGTRGTSVLKLAIADELRLTVARAKAPPTNVQDAIERLHSKLGRRGRPRGRVV